MTDYRYISAEQRGRIAIITIERADAHNALNAEAHREMSSILDDFRDDPDQWVAIVTGAGIKAFCAGHDLKQQAAGGGMETPPSGFGGLTSRFDLNKPVIAAVNGVAMGGGFELALACDIVVAADHAKFALPEVRVGLAALGGGLLRLPKEIGLKRSMALLLTGEAVSAERGVELGFVNEVTTGPVLDLAMLWAERIASCGPLSIRATKEAVRLGGLQSLEVALVDQWQYPAMKTMLESEDAIEGPLAFTEKRAPIWKSQ